VGVKVTIIQDRVRQLVEGVHALADAAVLVGVPEDHAERPVDPTVPGGGLGQINNAAIGYIHEFGAPEVGIPARPHLIPAIRELGPEATLRLQKIGLQALEGAPESVDKGLQALGVRAQSAVRIKLEDGPFVPLSPYTVANRFRQRGTKGPRKAELQYAALLAAGADPQAAQDEAGIRPLINTGEYRNAINYVVRYRKGFR
jgi:hypothetical protein